MESQFGYGRPGIMEVWVLDAGAISSHSLYMSNAEITWALIIPLGEGGGGTKSRGRANERSIMSRIFFVI